MHCAFLKRTLALIMHTYTRNMKSIHFHCPDWAIGLIFRKWGGEGGGGGAEYGSGGQPMSHVVAHSVIMVHHLTA